MKKETVITAAVFLAVGFLAGYIYDSQRNWSRQEQPPASAGTSGASDAVTPSSGTPAQASGSAEAGATGRALPPGHPSLETAAQMKDLEEQASRNPTDPDPPRKLANLFYDQHMFEQAVTWYQRALTLSPNDVSARTDLGTAYFNLGRFADALAEYNQSLKIDPTHEPTMYNIIVVNLEGTHDLKAARAAWEKLNRRDPNYPGLAGLKERLEAGAAGAIPTRSGASSASSPPS
jgi:Flp pilus assembly protein TadD